MRAAISLVSTEEEKVFPIPVDSLGRPLFIPQRGDQLSIEDQEYIVEGVKYYHSVDLAGQAEWAVAVFVHQMVR